MRRTGLTLIEVAIACVILFLVSFFIMALFSASFDASLHSRELTTATFLAEKKMEETLYEDYATPSSGAFSGAFQSYHYQISLQPYNTQFNMLIVKVNNVTGTNAQLTALIPAQQVFEGTATDQSSNTDSLSDQPGTEVDYYNGASFANPGPGSLPNNGVPSGIAADIFNNVYWAGDQNNDTVAYYNGDSWTALAKPAGMGAPAGVTDDEYANIVFVADKTNKCLWKYNNTNKAWTGPIRPASSGQGSALGAPSGIATDYEGNVVWVSDTGCLCLRFYDDDTEGWDPTSYAPNAANCSGCGGKTMATPMGIASTAYGNVVYVVDVSKVLWEYDVNARIWSIVSDQSSDPLIQSVSGLATDATGSTFWLNDPLSKSFWYYNGTTWTSKPY